MDRGWVAIRALDLPLVAPAPGQILKIPKIIKIFLPESAGKRKLSEQNKDLLSFAFFQLLRPRCVILVILNPKIYVADFGPIDRAF